MPLPEQPHQRLARLGLERLSDAELVALVLRRRGSAEAGAPADLLAEGLEGLAASPLAELSRRPGVGRSRAGALLAAFELGRRLQSPRVPTVTSPEDCLPYFQDMQDLRKETCRALYLDVRRRFLRLETISVGLLNATLIHPREIFQPALEVGATAVVVAHNHPSGDGTPSAQDLAVTRRLADAGEILGVELFDHLIVFRGGFTSLRASGMRWKTRLTLAS